MRNNWPIPPTPTTPTTSKPPTRIEPQNQEQVVPSATVAPKAEKCGWGPNCPICKNVEEDWDGDHKKQFQQNGPSALPQQPQMQGLQHPPDPKLPEATKFPALPVTDI